MLSEEANEPVLSNDLGILTSKAATAHREYQIFTKFEDPETYTGDKLGEIVSSLEQQDRFARGSVLHPAPEGQPAQSSEVRENVDLNDRAEDTQLLSTANDAAQPTTSPEWPE